MVSRLRQGQRSGHHEQGPDPAGSAEPEGAGPFSCACEGAGVLETLREDVDRYVVAFERDGRPRATAWPRLALSPRLWAAVNHRLAHYTLTQVRWRVLRGVLAALCFLGQRLVRNATGIQIDPCAHIGPGLFFPHEGFIVIGPVRIGRHATICQGATLGRGEGEVEPGTRDTPVLGDRVWVGPGAVVAGGLDIGSDAAVGANSVVLRDVPACGVVLGVPARVISYAGSFTKVHYRDSAVDGARSAAMATARALAANGGAARQAPGRGVTPPRDGRS